MAEATTATVDTQDNTNVSPEPAVQSTEPKDSEMFSDIKPSIPDESAEDKPFIDVEEGDKSDTDGDKEIKSPESYEPFNIELGKDIDYKISDDQFKEFSDLAKKLNLTQEQAQEFIDFDIKRNLAQGEQFNVEKQQAIKEDTEIVMKKYGEKFDESKVLYNKAIKAFMPKKLQKIFVDAGFDRNPELFDMMVAIGKTISEDTFVKGEKKVADPESFGKYSELLPQNPKLGKLK